MQVQNEKTGREKKASLLRRDSLTDNRSRGCASDGSEMLFPARCLVSAKLGYNAVGSFLESHVDSLYGFNLNGKTLDID